MKKSLTPVSLALLAALLAAGSVAACGGDENAGTPPPPAAAPGLKPSPRWLTFRCTTPGCDTTQTIQIHAVGDRRLSVRRVVLSDGERTDFELVTDRRPPFILGSGEFFTVDVRHLPTPISPRDSATLVVTWGDASDDTGPNRIEPQDLEIPLVRRVVGEAAVRVDPERLVFGNVRPNQEATLPLALFNEGFGNVPLAVASVVSSEDEFAAPVLPQEGALPGESIAVDVVFQPRRESYSEAQLLLSFADPTIPPVEVTAVGTSIVAGRIAFDPADGVDFGEIPRGSNATRMLKVVNQGGQPVIVDRLQTSGAYPGLSVIPPDELPLEIEPLGFAELTLVLDGQVVGPVEEQLSVQSNAGGFDLQSLPVRGLVAEPNVAVTPAAVDFGIVPRGWVSTQVVEVKNDGWGELEVQRISLVLGSSDLFRLAEIPGLPAILGREQRLPFTVEFRGQADSTFSGILSIETNDPDMPFLEVPLTGTSAACDAACSIPFATPTCLGGSCAIESCHPGRYDSDANVENGCECADPTADPGAFCGEGNYIGTLDDDGDRATFVGVVPTHGDVDFVRFFAKDSSQLFGDDYDVRISLDSSDPGVIMCVYWSGTADHSNECVLDHESCGSRSFRRDGDSFQEDGADYSIKVFRDPNQPASCSTYSIQMSNG